MSYFYLKATNRIHKPRTMRGFKNRGMELDLYVGLKSHPRIRLSILRRVNGIILLVASTPEGSSFTINLNASTATVDGFTIVDESKQEAPTWDERATTRA